jgi:hypothetical protein
VPSPLVEQVLSGANRQLTLLAARGLLPLPPDELVTLQVQLTGADDTEVSTAAAESLKGIEARVVVPFLGREAPVEVQRWFASHSRDRDVIQALLQRRDVAADVLLQLAPQLGADLQEMLLLRQDRITGAPELLDALEANPQLTTYSVRRIREYRDHLLGGAIQQQPAPAAAPAAAEVDVFADAEVKAAIVQAQSVAPEGEIEEKTGLSEGQIRQLPVNVRLKLARGAPRSLRSFLVRDSSALVAMTVLNANPLTDTEVEQFAKSRAVVPDVLEHIGKHRQWSAKYPVVLALCNNPRTPLNLALQLITRVAVRDLRTMAKDRNLPEAVRSQALRLYRVKSQ